MKRREFLQSAASITVIGSVWSVLGSSAFANESDCGTGEDAGIGAMKSFAYYQGLGPSETRNPQRTDGTYSKMPCISSAEIEACVEKSYAFWHGHGAETHQFTLKPEHFAKLKAGEHIEVFTNLVQGHRHALRIDPAEVCQVDSDE